MARTARKIGDPRNERLSVQEAKFVIEYIKDGNGQRSILDCGMCPSGNKQNASNAAVALLKQPRILKAIQEQLEAQSARTLITVDRILQEVYRGAVYNVAHAFDKDGNCLPLKDMPEDLQRAIEGFEVEEVRGRPGTFITKYKFSKKAVAQQMLLERLENLVKRFELSGPGGAPIHKGADFSDVSKELLLRIVGMADEASKPAPEKKDEGKK